VNSFSPPTLPPWCSTLPQSRNIEARWTWTEININIYFLKLLYSGILSQWKVWLTYIIHFYSFKSVYSQVGWFYSLAIVNSVMINMVSLLDADFIFFGYIPRSDIAKKYGISIFRVFRNFHTNFHSGCTNLHSYQEWEVQSHCNLQKTKQNKKPE
jgi:hypothetical protein